MQKTVVELLKEIKVGDRFNLWEVQVTDPVDCYISNTSTKPRYLCKCDCGKVQKVRGENLVTGKAKGCSSCANSKHGMYGTPEYECWRQLKGRCLNTNHIQYPEYGGRGIGVCQDWIDSFENFYEDMGDRPGPQYSIERIDNNGNYCPENCEWEIRKKQCRNRRSTHFITYQGETKPLIVWAEQFGINPTSLNKRLRTGWDIHRALTTPINQEKKRCGNSFLR